MGTRTDACARIFYGLIIRGKDTCVIELFCRKGALLFLYRHHVRVYIYEYILCMYICVYMYKHMN